MSNWLKDLFSGEPAGMKFGTMSLQERDREAAVSMLDTGEVPAGAVEDLEAFAKNYLKAEACAAFGDDVLLAGLSSLNEGDTVICPVFVHRTTEEALRQKRLNIHWLDVDPDTICLRAEEVEKELKKGGVRAVFLPYFLGIPPVGLDVLAKICRENGVLLIEDCRQAAGGMYGNQPLGCFGDIALFGFQAMMPVNAMRGGLVAVHQTGGGEVLQQMQAGAGRPHFSQEEILKEFLSFYKDRKEKDKGLFDFKKDNDYWEQKYSFVSPASPVKIHPAQAVLARHQWEQAEKSGYYRQNHLRLWQSYAEDFGWKIPVPPDKQALPAWLRAPVLIPEGTESHIQSIEERPEISRWYTFADLPQGIRWERFPNARLLSERLYQFPTEV